MIRIILLLLLLAGPANAQIALPFPGPGAAASGSAYQGPGDVVSGATAWGSCARAYNAAYANGTNPLCDLVDSAAPTTVICTLRVLTTGFVDLAGTYCTGSVTPAAKCAAATGGVCNISQVYDQTGNANHWTQVTAANQPTLTFSAINSLPALTFSGGASQLLATATKTIAQPFTFTGVYRRPNATQGGVIGSDAGVVICAGGGSGANLSLLTAGTTQTVAATDSVYHSMNHMVNGASSALNIDGSDTAGVNAGANAFSGNTIRIGRCAGLTLTGTIMEVGIYSASTTSTQRNNLSANQHSSNGYNF